MLKSNGPISEDYYNNRRRSVEREEREAGGPMDEFQRDEFERERFLKAGKMKKVERFLRQQGMRKEQIEREMEKAYEQYFSTLSKKEAAGGRQVLGSCHISCRVGDWS